MKEEVKCIECGSKYVVNKKFKLCERHNYERIHQGRSKNEIYSERHLLRMSQRKIEDSSEKSKRSGRLQSKNRINPISKKNRYRCSNGQVLTQSEINQRYKQACQEIDLDRRHICQGCNRADGAPLSHSHTISRSRCKQLGKAELIYDKENIFLECFGAPSSNPTECHNKWEVGSLEKKRTLLNFDRKLEYIKIHDPETYQKLI